MDWHEHFPESEAQLGAPVEDYTPPEHWIRKQLKGMGRMSHLYVDVAEQTPTNTGLFGDRGVTDGHVGVAYSSSVGSTKDVGDMGELLSAGTSRNSNANTYVRMVSHTTAANIGIFLRLKGRITSTSSVCSSGSQDIGYAYEAIECGMIDMILTGGGEEFCPSEVYVFDLLCVASCHSGGPELTPHPCGNKRDGLVTGGDVGISMLEELEHAKRRGVKVYAKLIGYSANSNGSHITQPQKEAMQKCTEFALQDTDIAPDKIGYVSGHGTATERGDVVEAPATEAAFRLIPMSSQRSYLGYTLGACGVPEAWFTIEMMSSDWFTLTINLNNIDPRCGKVDYILSGGREIETDYIVSNSFALGSVNTLLAFKRWQAYQKPNDRFSHDEAVQKAEKPLSNGLQFAQTINIRVAIKKPIDPDIFATPDAG